MVHLARKKRNGRVYLYLEQRERINGKSKRKWQIYLGAEDKIHETGISLAKKKITCEIFDFGISAALLQVAQKIGLIETIDDIAGKQRDQNLSFGEYMLINIVNRCAKPGSKSQLADWFKNDYLSLKYPIDPATLNAQTYWNHFQLLDEEKIAEIETELAKRILQEYQLDLSIILFDPTNFYTFISEHTDDQLAKFGHSKESRDNLRIINVSLLCTLLYGIPLFHYTYEGNVQDAKHFKGVITQITNRFKSIGADIEEITLLFDKGNHSQEAFTGIDNINLPFIASLRNSTQKDLLKIPTRNFTFFNLPSNGKEVGYFHIKREIYGKDRCVYVLLDPRKKRKDIANFEDKIELRLFKINEFLEKLNIKKWRDKTAVEKKLKELIGRKPFSTVISANVTGEYGELKVTTSINEENKVEYLETLGRAIIFTSLEDWSPEKIIQAFRDKYVVEDAFKQLKNTKFLSIRPMYHWADTCIRAHVFSSVLGLLLLSLTRLKLRQSKINLNYDKIINALSKLHVIQITTSASSPPLFVLNKLSPQAKQLYDKLKLKSFLPQ